MAKTEANVTVFGRLSFPVLTHAEAKERNSASPHKKANDSDVTCEFNLLLEQTQYDKFVAHVTDVFLPYCVRQAGAGEKRNALDQAQVNRILKVFPDNLEDQPPYVALKPVNEKTQTLMPDALASLKIIGPRGGLDLVQKAIVQDESELLVPDPDLLTFPVVKPIKQTVHQLYPGCYAATTVNLYTFLSGKVPGFSASAGTIVFKTDADRFGGGVEVDEDEIFED